MSILLVRHGETEGNVQRVLQRPDIELNARGVQQALRVAARLATFGAVRLIASDLTRARMTAEPIARATGLAVQWTPLLAERNFGELRGRPYGSLGVDPFAPGFVPPGGEGWDGFHDRVAQAFSFIAQMAGPCEGPVIVVTHGLVCRALVQRHLSLVGEHALPDRFRNTGVTIAEARAPYCIELLDCTAHLDAADGGGHEDRGGAA